MEWASVLSESIAYIELHLLQSLSVEEIAEYVHISPYYFQKGFKIMTGYTLGEYIRNRRLYLAALDVIKAEDKIVDIALQYGYETPESFTKAFSRFHGASPMQLKNQPENIVLFQPLQIRISVQGGTKMEYKIEDIPSFAMIGVTKMFSYEQAFEEIPKYWQEYCRRYCQKYQNLFFSHENVVYGISVNENMQGKEFQYLIAGKYQGEEVPEGLEVVQIPALTWAKFRCVGPMPTALQAINQKIFHEWLPGNREYEIAAGYNVECYTKGEISAKDYECEIWIPVRKKQR